VVGIATLLLAGDSCDEGPYMVGTLHSPFTEADLVSDNRLLGSWVGGDDDDDDEAVVFQERGRGHYVMYMWETRYEDSSRHPTSTEFDLYQLGDHLVMDWGSAYGLDSTSDRFGDLAGMRVMVPQLCVMSGDTLRWYKVPPSALMHLAEEGGDSVTWIDRGGVRLIRGSSAQVKGFLLRLFADTTMLESEGGLVRASFGAGPVQMTAAAPRGE
jgi:hypothetical protein